MKISILRKDFRIHENKLINKDTNFILVWKNTHNTALVRNIRQKQFIESSINSFVRDIQKTKKCVDFFAGDIKHLLNYLQNKFRTFTIFLENTFYCIEDNYIFQYLKEQRISFEIHNNNIFQVFHKQYKVYTFYKNYCYKNINQLYENNDVYTIDELKHIYNKNSIEKLAINQFYEFTKQNNYDTQRDLLSSIERNEQCTSKISHFLSLGTLSAKTVFLLSYQKKMYKFCDQLLWREFSYHTLYFHPKLFLESIQNKYDDIWNTNVMYSLKEKKAFLKSGKIRKLVIELLMLQC